MCGICGIYEYKTQKPVDQQILDDMLQRLQHRGPDDAGAFLDRDVSIGMRRLSIIDLNGGKQPISNEDGTVVTVFNGEIYNYRSLREQLEGRGHVLATESDTEVIVHLYEEFGEQCVQHLRGMFGFAVWDKRKRQLLLARDRLGIKPLYYTQAGGRLIFGSEIKAILQHPSVKAALNTEGLNNLLSLKYVPAPQTMFEDIYALPPGSILKCDANGVEVRRYWDLSFANHHDGNIREEEYAERLEALMRECVKMHLISDVPFGAFLSGGLDSSTIVALMSQFLNEPVKTYSVGFEGQGQAFSELPYARVVANRFRTDHHEVFIRPAHLVDLAQKVVWHLDQPLAQHLASTNATASVNRMLYVDTKLWLPDLLLARGDKMSMAVSLEARVPLLDHKLVEFAASLPQNLKLKGLVRKYLLKKVSQRWLPREIIHRKKQGFPMPSSLWLRNEARSFVRDLLSPSVLKRRGLFNPAFVESLIQQHENGFADHGSLLWGLMNVELWQRVFMDSRVQPQRRAGALAAQAV